MSLSNSWSKHHINLVEKVNAGDLQSVQSLLSSSVEYSQVINNVDANGCTPIFYAAWMGRSDICQELIKSGANIYQAVKTFRPIHVAASKNHLQVVKLLINHGDKLVESDLAKIQKSKKQTLKISDEIVALAMENIDDKNDMAMTANKHEITLEKFFVAVSEGNMIKIKKYVSRNLVNINSVIVHNTKSKFYKMTPLHAASKFGQYKVVLYLVKHGAQYMPGERKNMETNNVNDKKQMDNNDGNIHGSVNQSFYLDLRQNVNLICDSCEQTESQDTETALHHSNAAPNEQENNNYLNHFVLQLHEQVDQSLFKICSTTV